MMDNIQEIQDNAVACEQIERDKAAHEAMLKARQELLSAANCIMNVFEMLEPWMPPKS